MISFAKKNSALQVENTQIIYPHAWFIVIVHLLVAEQ